MKLIQLPTQAFEERLKQEIEENPALDTGKEEPDDFEDSLANEHDDDGTEKIDTDDINIDDYLSDDEIPNYKTQANNYSADDVFVEIDLAQKIEESINSLPQKRREIFILSRQEGLKYHEIAKKLNIYTEILTLPLLLRF